MLCFSPMNGAMGAAERFTILALAPHHQHRDAHEGTDENREKGKECIHIHYSCPNQKSDDTRSSEEDIQCFS